MRKQNKGRDREGESDEPALQGQSHSAGLQQHKALPLSGVLAPQQHVPQLTLAVSPHPGPLCLAASPGTPPQLDSQDSVSSLATDQLAQPETPLTSHTGIRNTCQSHLEGF